jgi:hypothetical protein
MRVIKKLHLVKGAKTRQKEKIHPKLSPSRKNMDIYGITWVIGRGQTRFAQAFLSLTVISKNAEKPPYHFP